jgi:hypothetical protein
MYLTVNNEQGLYLKVPFRFTAGLASRSGVCDREPETLRSAYREGGLERIFYLNLTLHAPWRVKTELEIGFRRERAGSGMMVKRR